MPSAKAKNGMTMSGRAQDLAPVRVEVADQQAEQERDDGREHAVTGDVGEAGGAEEQHGEERAVVEGGGDVGAAVAVVAVAAGEGQPQAAVAVVDADEQGEDRDPEDAVDADELTEQDRRARPG